MLLLIISFKCDGQKWIDFEYKNGDLVFQDIDCGGLCDAIETVTPPLGNKRFSHIGIVYARKDSVFVIEAIGSNVHMSPINSFLLRQVDEYGKPKVVVGRLKRDYSLLGTGAVAYSLKQVGVPYDDEFIYNNSKYYCSELIYDAYKNANGGKSFFELKPMIFKDPKTGKIFPAWTSYYLKLGKKIPEGKPGCNPGLIANDKRIDIVAEFY